jgi:hypothetical protein
MTKCTLLQFRVLFRLRNEITSSINAVMKTINATITQDFVVTDPVSLTFLRTMIKYEDVLLSVCSYMLCMSAH